VSLVDQLTEKPWLTEGCEVEGCVGEAPLDLRAPHLGLKVLLGVASALFMLVVVAYAYRMTFGDWQPMHQPWLLWVNTLILVLGSWGMHRAWGGAYSGQLGVLKSGMVLGGGCAVVFLGGQLLVWKELVSQGFFASYGVSVAFFYVVTALHAAHVFGGLIAWYRASLKIWRDDDIDNVRITVELCATYWHFLLCMWIILFGLLLLT